MDENFRKSKIVLLGDQSVGKTSIINRFIFDNFTGNQQPTVGVDFVSKSIKVENTVLRIQLWDTAGQERFYSLIPSYIKDCCAAIIVFDLTNANSITNLNKWIDNVREVRGDEAIIMIAGNKADLADERSSQSDAIKTKMKNLGLHYMEVSAKQGTNIQEFFKDLTVAIATTIKGKTKTKTPELAPNQNANPNVQLSTSNHQQETQTKKKKKCC